MWVVLQLQNFKDFEIKKGVRLPFPIVIDPEKMIGYLPVYETREDALADYPDEQLQEIRWKKQEE